LPDAQAVISQGKPAGAETISKSPTKNKALASASATVWIGAHCIAPKARPALTNIVSEDTDAYLKHSST
jgi:hypothetical protein